MTDANGARLPDPWPTELKVADRGRTLKVSFEDGQSFELTAEYLRVMSPSAEVQGHSRKERKTVGGKRNVAVVGVDPIGTYAVKLSFDDLHATGIYTWAYLYDLGLTRDEKWGAYLQELEASGLGRDKAGESSVGSAGRDH
jgi:DUF971 family protein